MKTYHYCRFWLLGLLMAAFAIASCSDEDEGALRYPVPTIASFSPSEGLPTAIVTITGTEFGSERTERIGRVYFGGVEATDYVSWSDSEIQVRVPEGGVSGPITLWVWKNHVETAETFTCLPGASITSVSTNLVSTGSTFRAYGENFAYFLEQGITVDDIVVTFPSADGTVSGIATGFTEEYVEILVPEGARGGAFTVQFGELQIVTGPNIEVSGFLDYYFTHKDVVQIVGSSNPCSYTGEEGSGTCFYDKGVYADGFDGSSEVGSFTLWDSVSGDVCVFQVNILEENDYYIYFGTKGRSTGNLTILAGDDPDNLALSITQECSADSYNWPATEYEFGPYHLEAGVNYVRIDFGASLSLTDIHITNERLEGENIIVGTETMQGLYACDFNDGDMAPFSIQWAWEPNYIEVVDNVLEFYYDQAALDADDRRERRGCEVVCDFRTTSEGWYGFRFFLPDGKFPKDVDGSIIAQIFNCGDRNSWAGHISVDQDKLHISHRHALVDPVIGEIGTVQWNEWIPVVVYFRAGRNNQGCIRAWMGDDMAESSPAYEADNINFAFGEWTDDTHLNGVVSAENEVADYLSCKFGLYVSSGGDRTIRFDDIKVLEGNPSRAFDIVRP